MGQRLLRVVKTPRPLFLHSSRAVAIGRRDRQQVDGADPKV